MYLLSLNSYAARNRYVYIFISIWLHVCVNCEFLEIAIVGNYLYLIRCLRSKGRVVWRAYTDVQVKLRSNEGSKMCVTHEHNAQHKNTCISHAFISRQMHVNI